MQTVILARLLLPSDFGIMAMASVAMNFATIMSNMGIGPAMIQKKDVTLRQMSSLYWLNIFLGCAVALGLILLSPVVSAFFKQPILLRIIPIVSLSLFIGPIGKLFYSYLQKELYFKTMTICEIGSSLTGLAVAVVAALLKQGVYALVWGGLAAAAARSLLSVILCWQHWRPILYFDSKEVRGFLHFGIFNSAENFVNFLSANIDYLVVGRVLGAQTLGVYRLAYELVVMPLTRINPILNRVAFPLFSKLQDDNDILRKGYTRSLAMLAHIVTPISVFLAVAAPQFVVVFFGAKWMDAAVIIRILSVMGVLKALANPAGSVINAKGRPDIGFYWNVFVAALNSIVFWYAAQRGILYVAGAWSCLIIVYYAIFQSIANWLIGLSWNALLGKLWQPVFLSAVAGLVALILQQSLPIVGIPTIGVLASCTLLGAATYAFLVFRWSTVFTQDLFILLGKRSGV